MDKPLVTVSVISFNSAKTVLETLESIYDQTYPRIELIISDDSSYDDTVNVCMEWLQKHKNRFESSRVIESDNNTGITANCNRAITNINGDYVKLLAADDLLFPNALTDYVNYMISNPAAVYVFSQVEVFGDRKEVVKRFADTIFDYSFFQLSHDDQYKWLIGNRIQPIPAVSVFINVKLAASFGVLYYDERIPMLEDWPKWIQVSENNLQFHFIEKQLVKYRVSDSSVCTGDHYAEAFRQSRALMYFYYQFHPTARLFGKRRAWALYVKNKAIIKRKSIWGFLARIIDCLLKIRAVK